MSRVIQAGEFFVVGGPVQPDRLCYVERTADRVLEASIQAHRFAYVFAPRATGKSSLMGRAVRHLRRSGELAGVVDLAQLDARGASIDENRWLCSIAHRIAHELRIKVDVDDWWREKSALGEQRLDDFFWEIVLTNTTAPVTVFFDEIERATYLPFAAELFATIRACYGRRAAEPDYARLNFVVLGVAAARGLCPDERLSPFADGVAVALDDFDAQQSYQLAPGLGGEPELAQALLDRIRVWTGGHPYLTQKIARAVARKGGKLEDVERTVKEQLLAPAPTHEDPLLSQMHAVLTARSPAARRARRLLAQIARGKSVRADRPSAALESLELAGVVAVDAGGVARYRNRIFAEAFGRRWLKATRPKKWILAASAALILLGVAASALWYRQYVPEPYLRALEDPRTDLAALGTAHARLRNLPGFAPTADELYARALELRSIAASDHATASAADAALRTVLGQPELADRLLTDYWLRAAVSAMHREQRDAALLYAHAALPSEPARRLLAELIGPDYAQLALVLQPPAAPASFVADWQGRRLVGLDAAHRLQTVRLDQRAPAASPGDERFTVLEPRPLERTVEVDETGSAGAFTLTVLLDHAAADDLSFTLRAPSGAESAAIAVPRGVAAEELAFAADPGSPLAALADEDRAGDWRLSIVDAVPGNAGTLVSWALKFDVDGVPWRDVPADAGAVPDALRAVAGRVTVAANGRFALAHPPERHSVGALALWDLRTGALLRDLPVPRPPSSTEVAASGARIAAVAANTLSMWSTAEPAAAAIRIATQTGFVLPPALSPDGDYVSIAEELDAGPPLYSLLRAADGALLSSVEGVPSVDAWLLGPEARYLVLLGREPAIRVMDPRRGGAARVLEHARSVERVVPLPSGSAVLTVDSAGDIRVWEIGGANGATARLVGVTIDPASVSAAADGARVAFAARGATVQVVDGRTGARLATLRMAAATASTALSPDGRTLVTIAPDEIRVWALDAGSPAARALVDPELSAVALDPPGERAARGSRGGYVQVGPAAALGAARRAASLDYFGHRGAVASLAIDSAHDLVASGGARDATVRLWNAASGEPGVALPHAAPSIVAVALSHDGRLVAGAAASSVRIWRIADGTLLNEVAAPSATALAFSADDRLLAIGDAAGGVATVAVADGAPASARVALRAAPRWLAPGPGARWLVATDHWLHALELAPSGATVLLSRFLPANQEPAAAASASSVWTVRDFGTLALDVAELALDVAPAPLAPQAPELAKDWRAVLGLTIGSGGTLEPYTP